MAVYYCFAFLDAAIPRYAPPLNRSSANSSVTLLLSPVWGIVGTAFEVGAEVGAAVGCGVAVACTVTAGAAVAAGFSVGAGVAVGCSVGAGVGVAVRFAARNFSSFPQYFKHF